MNALNANAVDTSRQAELANLGDLSPAIHHTEAGLLATAQFTKSFGPLLWTRQPIRYSMSYATPV
ncbi:hypothetical protein YK56LOC_69660 [Caballeronia sp. HLA56]